MSDPTVKAPPREPHCRCCWSVWSLRKCAGCHRIYCSPTYKDCMAVHGCKGGP